MLFRCILFLLLDLSLIPSATAACSRALRVPVEDWPPYAYRDVGKQPAGLDIELLQAVAREAGCVLQFHFDIPRKRRLLMFQQGELDLLIAASITAERRAYAYFTRPYRDEVVAALIRAEDATSLNLVSLEQLLQKRIALVVPNAGWYGDAYARLLPAFEAAGLITRYEDYAQGVRQLAAGRGKVLIGDYEALLVAGKAGQLSLTTLPFDINRNPVHFMLSRASLGAADLASLDRAILSLVRRGELRAIAARYLSSSR